MNLADLLNGFGGPWSYPVIGLFAFLESAAFVGLVIPGETAMLLGGVLAATGQVTLLPMVLAGVLGAVLGDLAGYGLGRLAGPAVRNGRAGRAGRWVGEVRWRRAEELVARRGGPAVFVGRWIGLLRAVVPFVAGSIRMPRAQFMAWNAVGGTLWATTVICLGYAAGASWQRAQAWLGNGALIAGLVGVAVGAGVLGVRRVRRRRAGAEPALPAAAALPADSPAPPGWRPRPRLVLGALLAGVLAVAVGELSDNVLDGGGVTAIDAPVLGWVLVHRQPDLTTPMIVITTLGGTGVMAGLALVAVAVLGWRWRWRDAVLVAMATLGAGLLVVGLKPLIGRVRPPQIDHLVLETNQSFPSGHAVGAAAVLGVLAVVAVRHLHRRVPRVAVGVAALGATVAIGVSRLYLRVHWASDVLGGWLVGGLWLTVCVSALALWAPRPGAGAAPGVVGALEGDDDGGRSEATPTATPTPDPDPAIDSGSAGRVGPRPTPR